MNSEPTHSYFGTPLSEWISLIPNELEDDAVGLWQIIPTLRKAFGLEGAELERAIREALAKLLARGTKRIAQKVGEEAVETVIEAVRGRRDKLIAESADLIYHLMVLWADARILPSEIWAELARREGASGIEEKAARDDDG